MPSRRIEDLDQRFQPMVRNLLDWGQKLIDNTGWKLFITDGFRSFQEQNELYAQGRTKPGKIVTNAKGGQSAHNYGLAVDLAFQKAGVLSYSPDLYAPIYSVARSMNFELGADWTSFPDKPHFAYPNWRNAIINDGGEKPMPNMYKGLDLSNADSMRVAVDTWADVRDGKYVKKEESDRLIKEAYERGKKEAPKPQPQQPVSSVDLNKWMENGLTTEEMVGPMKVITNYKRK